MRIFGVFCLMWYCCNTHCDVLLVGRFCVRCLVLLYVDLFVN